MYIVREDKALQKEAWKPNGLAVRYVHKVAADHQVKQN